MNEQMELLVVDDNPDMCELLATVLSLEGFRADTATSGMEALGKFKSRFYNAVLLDLRLPDIDGIELLGTLKQISPDTEVIMITAFASMESAIRALNHGAAAYVMKPFEIEDVTTTVNRALEKQRLAFENRLLLSELERKNAELARLAVTDGLTGLYNRRFFEEMLEREEVRASRYEEPVSIIVADVNNLKQINDTLGHDRGDILIEATARLLNHVCRASDLVARYGGDEFVVLMPETNAQSALHLVRRIREAAAQWRPPETAPGLILSLAIGSASTNHLVSLRKAFRDADARMYRDKERYYRAKRREAKNEPQKEKGVA